MSELEQQMQNRRRKREELATQGIAAFPHRWSAEGALFLSRQGDLEPAEVQARYGGRSAAELEAALLELRVPGRVRALREHGKTVFLDLHDGRAKLQVMVRRAELPAGATAVLAALDLGDYLGAAGRLLRTRSGELTLAAADLVLLAKALRPLPEKWHGLADVEARYRRRYLDLLVNPESRRVFEVRAALVRGLREFLERHGFLEVETPMMQPLAGGAVARPFVTHHNALGLDLYLRIAPELYLKRLLVGGIHRVYEINRNFRNEGISSQHNPEFTMLEFYWAYADHARLMGFTEAMLARVAAQVLGEPAFTWRGERIDLGSGGWPRYTMRQAITRFAGVDPARLEHVADLAAIAAASGCALPAALGDPGHPALHAGSRESFERRFGDIGIPAEWYGYVLMELFEKLVESRLVQPTFIHEYPVEVSPFAKQCPGDPRFTERFELYIGGMEVANAFTELNDPDVQAERFRQQLAARARGDEEAHRFDHDFIRALEHGMPPAGGEGIGVDRLVMLFTDRPSIRDVILFPLLRPRRGREEEG